MSTSHRRSNLALAVALLALVMAMSGTAIAAGLTKNSVKSKHVKNNSLKSQDIKNGSLTGIDVKDDSLTGADVNEATLQGVDAATLNRMSSNDLAPRLAYARAYGDLLINNTGQRDFLTVSLTLSQRSLVQVEASGTMVATATGLCPCVEQVHILRQGESRLGTSPNFTQVALANLDPAGAGISGYDRIPFAGHRVFNLEPGTHTFRLHGYIQHGGVGAPVGANGVRLSATAYPISGDGSPVQPGS